MKAVRIVRRWLGQFYYYLFPVRTVYRGWRIQAGSFAATGTRLNDGEQFVIARLPNIERVLKSAKKKIDRLEGQEVWPA